MAASSSPTLRVGKSAMRPSTKPGRKPSTGMLCRMSSSGSSSRSAARERAAVHPNTSANPYETRSASTPRVSEYSRSEEHTSELQSLAYLVCRLLLEKKKKTETLDQETE